MDEIFAARQLDRLTRRREQLVTTLHHLSREQEEVTQNTDWLDQVAYEKRVNLLDRLNDWYLAELTAIDKAAGRIQNARYGYCVGCHNPIETQRLETAPEAEFCARCKDMREGLMDL